LIEIANVKGWSERKVAWTYSPRQLRLIFTTILRSRFAPIEMILRGLGVATKGDEATGAPGEKSVARKAKPKHAPAKSAAKQIPAWIRKQMRPGVQYDVAHVDDPIATIEGARIPVVKAPLGEPFPRVQDVLNLGLKVDMSRKPGPPPAVREAAERDAMKALRVQAPAELLGGKAHPDAIKAAAQEYAEKREFHRRFPGRFKR
jgi:hypothetical protein